uniref:Secreted protein n=1 Tax=Anopheles dirus TaxID=7168 RepID=A0A182N7S2_9DIPT
MAVVVASSLCIWASFAVFESISPSCITLVASVLSVVRGGSSDSACTPSSFLRTVVSGSSTEAVASWVELVCCSFVSFSSFVESIVTSIGSGAVSSSSFIFFLGMILTGSRLSSKSTTLASSGWSTLATTVVVLPCANVTLASFSTASIFSFLMPLSSIFCCGCCCCCGWSGCCCTSSCLAMAALAARVLRALVGVMVSCLIDLRLASPFTAGPFKSSAVLAVVSTLAGFCSSEMVSASFVGTAEAETSIALASHSPSDSDSYLRLLNDRCAGSSMCSGQVTFSNKPANGSWQTTPLFSMPQARNSTCFLSSRMCLRQCLQQGSVRSPHFTPPSVYAHFGSDGGFCCRPSVALARFSRYLRCRIASTPCLRW